MAGTTRKEVELRINANDLSQKSLSELLDTFNKLKDSQEALGKSSDGTQRHMRELAQDLKDFQAVAVELKARSSLVDQFLDMQTQATNAAARVSAAKVALQAFNAAQVEGSKLTAEQKKQLTALTGEVKNSEKSLARSTTRLGEFGEKLKGLGSGGDVGTVQRDLIEFSATLGTALAQAEASIRSYDAALRASAQKTRDDAKAKREAAEATAELKRQQDALAAGVAFNKQGRDALTAAANIEVLSRDYDKLATSSRKASDGIRDILDPSRQAVETLDALEAEIKRLNTQLDSAQTSPKLGEELKQIRTEYNAFAADAGRAAASLVDDIASYRKVEASLASLRTRLEATQQSVQKFAAQKAISSAPNDTLQRDLTGAEAALKGLIGEFDREAQVLANLKLRLREAGVDVNKLADAETRLAGVAGGVVESQRKIEAAAARLNKLAKAANDVKTAEEELAAGVAFNRVGRDALKAAGSIEALSRDYDALAASSAKAGDGVRGIIDPSRQALTSLDGLEEQTKKLNTELQKAASSVKLREELRKLRNEYGSLATDAGKAAASLGDDIGAYRQAEQALGTLRARVEAARQSVEKFAGQMSMVASPSEELSSSLKAAKGQLNTLVGEFERQSMSLAKLRGNLREAGVSVDKLAEAETRLKNVARGVVTAQEALGVAAIKVGEGAKRAAKGLDLFDDKGRKTLSMAQRLRGEMLSLASSYLGVFAAANAAKGALEVAVTRETVLRQLELVTGSAEAAKTKLEEVTRKTREMGLVSLPAAEQYAKFALAMKKAGVEAKEADNAFFDMLSVAKNVGLTTEQFKGYTRAAEQMAALNKVGAEELNQMADAGVNAKAAIANAMGMELSDFIDRSEKGLIGVHALSAGMRQLAKDTSALSKNPKSVVDGLRAFEEGVNDLKLAIADSGFLETMVKLLNEFSAAVKDGKFNEAIKGFGTLLMIAAESARFLLEHLNLTFVVIGGFVGLKVGAVLLGIAVHMKTLGLATGLAGRAFSLLRGAVMLLIAHPFVALVAGLVLIATQTKIGRAAMHGLWQILVEVGGAIGDLLNLDFTAFIKRVAGSAERIKASFKDVKDEAEELSGVVRGTKERPAGAGGAAGSASAPANTGGATGSWGDDADPEEAEVKRRAEAELTAKTVARIEKGMADVRKAAAKEEAKAVGDMRQEVVAEYQDSYDDIEKLRLRSVERNDAAAGAEAAKQKAALDGLVDRVVKARKRQEAAAAGNKDRASVVAEALEAARQRAEATKDGLRLERAELEQNYREGVVSLRTYYAGRLSETKRGLEAEIEAAREQIAILEQETPKTDPNAAKKITKLRGDIARKEQEQKIAERTNTTDLNEAEKALRRQVSAVQDELDLMTGDERQAGMRAIQNFYDDALEKTNELEGAEKDRALATLNTVKGLKEQHLEIQLMRKEAEHLFELQHAKIDNQVASGGMSQLQELEARSKANQGLLEILDGERARLILNGQVGSDAYKKIEVEIERLRGSTELLEQEVTAVFKDAASSFVTTLIDTKSPQKALKAFGKSLGASLAKSFTDEAATGITKWFKESGGFKALLNLFKGIGGMFSSGGAAPAQTGHTGAVIGYGGGVPRMVSPLAFLGAPRYHDGAVLGLRRDEVRFIGQVGEEVLAKDDPRNVLNGGKNPSAPGPSAMRVEIHPDALRMTLRDWLEGELARAGSTQ